MLLPSALTCDSSHRGGGSSTSAILPRPRVSAAATALFASPPISPPQNSHSSLFATCRALQSMLRSPSPLPTPPMTAHALVSPNSNGSGAGGNGMKLRLRARKPEGATGAAEEESRPIGSGGGTTGRRRVVKKRTGPPPRGINKRRRAVEDEEMRERDDDHDDDDRDEEAARVPGPARMILPHTPPPPSKRLRLVAPLPLGLARSDFQNLVPSEPYTPSERQKGERQIELRNLPSLQEPEQPEQQHQQQQEEEEEGKEGRGKDPSQRQEEGEEDIWSTAEDLLLVELVLDKLRLSKSDWQDCARSLGKDRGSVGRRWKSLVGGGEVGLRRTRAGAGAGRRGGVWGTWRV